jgi:hypothetical protein
MAKSTRFLLMAMTIVALAWLLLAVGLSDTHAAGPRWRRNAGPEYGSGSGGNYGQPSLPQGRRYYNGRYFGNFNNRYYGPQYGYF